jgi:hypothetical protein
MKAQNCAKMLVLAGSNDISAMSKANYAVLRLFYL